MTGVTIQKMIHYFNGDVKRINHALKVYGFASGIARRENLTENQTLIVDIAAVLHDIGIKEAEKKYNSSNGRYQEIEGPAVAQALLKGMKLENITVNRILFLIGNHHSYEKIDGVDFQVLIEADFLVNIFEDKLSKSLIENIRRKYFKTNSGIFMIESMYL